MLLILVPYCFLFLPTWIVKALSLSFPFSVSFFWRAPLLSFIPLSPQSQNAHHQLEALSPSIINDKWQSAPGRTMSALPKTPLCPHCWKEWMNYHLNTRISKIHPPLLTSAPESGPSSPPRLPPLPFDYLLQLHMAKLEYISFPSYISYLLSYNKLSPNLATLNNTHVGMQSFWESRMQEQLSSRALALSAIRSSAGP